jgi:lipopolysaccharide export system protein LptC
MSLLRQAWERLSLYLPVFLMGILAMTTYWLMRSAPPPTSAEPAAAPKHEADYFLRQFNVKTFDSTGRLKSEVMGQEARHFPDTNTLEIQQVSIRAYNEQGRLTTAQAKQAITNGDASEVQLIGQAHMVREASVDKAGVVLPELSFRGEFLHAFMNTERVKSHKPVELIHGKNHFTADSMDFDNLDRLMTLQGRVKGLLVPSTAH